MTVNVFGVPLPGFKVEVIGALVPMRRDDSGAVIASYEPIRISWDTNPNGMMRWRSWTGQGADRGEGWPGIHDSAERARRYLTGEYVNS